VEFVCTGNICRSPFAAAIAVAFGIPGAQVHSSGLCADPGRGCPREAEAVAAEHGVDLTRHGAHPTELGELHLRDWVMVMEYGHLREVRRLLPSRWSGRAVLLGEFCAGAGVEIPDPYGGSLREYRAVYRLIREAVGNWVAATEESP
jgi:protein-tyrosine phosphatase